MNFEIILEAPHDYLKLQFDKKILKLFDTNENLLFSAVGHKFNTFGWKQKRTIIITNKGFYNVKDHKLKRKIAIEEISSIVISEKYKNYEFVLHIPKEYDYHYLCFK